MNLTDAPLTFFFTLTLFLARATLVRYEARLRWKALAALTGLAAAGGFLSKGLVAIVLPGAILFLWCLATRRMRFLTSLLFGPALPVFLLAAAPWFVLAERRTPGFLQFFFIHEHFQRFSTSVAQRPGPIYYFVLIFLAGFLPVIPFFLSSLKKAWRRDEPEALFFLLWFAVVLVFFSLSRSKLPPYLMPAFPAAAALAARALFERQPAGQGAWRVSALLATLLPAYVIVNPTAQAWVRDYALAPIAIAGLAVLLLGTWAAPALAKRSVPLALGALRRRLDRLRRHGRPRVAESPSRDRSPRDLRRRGRRQERRRDGRRLPGLSPGPSPGARIPRPSRRLRRRAGAPVRAPLRSPRIPLLDPRKILVAVARAATATPPSSAAAT